MSESIELSRLPSGLHAALERQVSNGSRASSSSKGNVAASSSRQPQRPLESPSADDVRVAVGEETEAIIPPAGSEAFDSYPDGGAQAWLQIFYCFCIFFTTIGGIYLWGVFQDALYAEGLAPSSTLAFIGSTQATFEGLCAIPFSGLVAAYGPRKVAIVGALFSGIGPVLASWCTKNLAGMFVTEAFMFGIGQALCFFCAATLPSNYFLRRRNLATGLVYAGGGLGGAALSPIVTLLINKVGLPWAFRIVGIAFLGINLPCAYLLNGRRAVQPLRFGFRFGLGSKKRNEGGSGGRAEPGKPQSTKRFVDWALLKDARFVFVLLAASVGVFPIFVTPFFLPLFGSSIGLPSSTSSLMLAGFNLASAFGRIGFGLGADHFLGSVNAFLLCMFSNALSTLVIWPLAGSVSPLLIYAVVNGFCSGGDFSLLPGVVATLFSHEQLPVAFSMIVSACTPGYFLGAPVAGYLLQAYGGPDSGYEAYRPAIFYAGGLSLFSAVMVLGVRVKQGGWRLREKI